MSESAEPLDQLIERVRKFSQGDVDSVVAATERFSPERNQALLLARTIAHKRVESWSERLNEAENAANRRFTELEPKGDTLKRAVFLLGIQGATLATIAKPALTPADYRRLVKPAATVVRWLADESGAGVTAPPPAEVRPIEDDDRDGEPASSAEEEMATAIATKPTVKKAKAEPKAAKPKAEVKAEPEKPKATNQAPGAHAVTKHRDLAKKMGVRVARNPHGGFHVTVVGTLYRALSGVWDTAADAERAAKEAKFEVKSVAGAETPEPAKKAKK